ncbi:MAG: NAD(P)-dependent oxidoreductase [Verrucomicrobiota bacterium]
MKILLTGCAGYVGSMVAHELLAQGHSVRGYDNLMYGGEAMLGFWSNPAFDFVKGDVRDVTKVRPALEGCDGIVHLAAIVGDPACKRDPELARSTNLDGSIVMIEEAKQAGVSRFVFASTCSNYGKMADPDRLVDESSELSPVSLYAETKVAVETLVMDAEKMGEVCGTSLRFSTVYGVSPRMRYDLTVNQFAREAWNDRKLVVFGEQFWRPYIHVRDMARGVAVVCVAPEDQVRGEVFNVGSTAENYTKKMIVELLQELVPGLEVEYVSQNDDPRDYRVSFAKIETRLGFKVSRTVRQGLQETLSLISQGVLPEEGRKFGN